MLNTVQLSWGKTTPLLIEVHKISTTTTSPTVTLVGTTSPTSFTIPKDGAYYITATDPTKTTERITAHIDTTPPEQITVRGDLRVSQGSVGRFLLSASDSQSGLQKIMYVKIDEELFYPTGKELFIPFYRAGDYSLTVRVFDRAGNYRDETVTVRVE